MRLLNGDCLELMKDVQDDSIDMILCDLPYGIKRMKWDIAIPFDKMWEHYERIIKDNGVIALFGQEPFSSALRMSNLKMYRYDIIWNKHIPSGMSYARYRPMKQTENISIFYKEPGRYNPQMITREKPIKSGGMKESLSGGTKGLNAIKKEYKEKFPTDLVEFCKVRKGAVHPTQKPVPLLEYLIKTYTNEGETVLDNCCGSGSTGVACVNTGRNFIGMELDGGYFDIAKNRIGEARKQIIMED